MFVLALSVGRRTLAAQGVTLAQEKLPWGLHIEEGGPQGREMGGAPRNPAPRNHLFGGLSNHQAATAQMHLAETNIAECRPLLGALPLSLTPGRMGARIEGIRLGQYSCLASTDGSDRTLPRNTPLLWQSAL